MAANRNFRQFGGIDNLNRFKFIRSNNIQTDELTINNDLFVDGSLVVGGSTTFTNVDIEFNNGIDVCGNSEISGNLNTKGNNNVEGNLNVDGTSTMNGNLDMQNNKIINVEYPTDASDAANRFFVLEQISAGTSSFLDGIDVCGNSEISGNLRITETLNVDNGIVLSGDLQMNNNIDMSGDICMNNNRLTALRTPLNTDLSDATNVMFVLNAITDAEQANFNNGIDVCGNSEISGNLRLKGNLNMDGNDIINVNTALDTDLSHAANVFFVLNEISNNTVDIDLNNGIDVCGNSEISGNLNVIGTISTTENLNLSNNRIVNLSTPVDLSDAANKDYVDSQIQANQIDISFNDGIDVCGNSEISGNLLVKGSIITTNTLDMCGNQIINMAEPTDISHVTSKFYVDNIANTITTSLNNLNNTKLNVNGTNSMIGNLDMSGNKILNVLEPTDLSDVTTKNYVDLSLNTKLNIDGSNFMTGNLDMSGNNIIGLATATETDLSHAANVFFVLNEISNNTLDFNDGIDVCGNSEISGNLKIIGTLDLSNNRIINVSYPVDASDVANKQYVMDEIINAQNANFNDGIDVSGNSEISGNLRVTETLLVNNGIDLSGNLNMDIGDICMNNNNIIGLATATETDLSYAANVFFVLNEISNNTVDVDFNNGIDVCGNSEISGNLLVKGSITTTNTLDMSGNQIINMAEPTDISHVTSKFYVDNIANTLGTSLNNLNNTKLNVNGTNSMTGNLDMSGNKILNVLEPTDLSDVATKNYVDLSLNAKLNIDGSNFMIGNLDLSNNRIVNVSYPVDASDVANKQYVMDEIINAQNANFNDGIDVSGNSEISGNLRIIGTLDLSNNRIVNVSYPVDASDVANKQYVMDEIINAQNANFNDGIDVSGNSEISGNLRIIGTLDLSNNRIVNVSYPVDASDVANKQYVMDEIINAQNANFNDGIDVSGNSEISGNLRITETLLVDNGIDLSGNLNMDIGDICMNNNNIVGLATATETDLSHAANVFFVLNEISNNTVDFNDGIDVCGNSEISGNLRVTEDLDVSGGLVVDNGLEVSGNIFLNGRTRFAFNPLDIHMGNNKLLFVREPENPDEGANKNYVDVTTLRLSGVNPMQGNIDMSGNKIIKVIEPTDASDVATKNYVDANAFELSFNDGIDVSGNSEISGNLNVLGNLDISGGVLTVRNYAQFLEEAVFLGDLDLRDGAKIRGILDMCGNKIIKVDEPTDLSDVATKNYVDTEIQNNVFELSFNDGIDVCGNSEISGNLNIIGNLDVSGLLIIDSSTNLDGGAIISNGLTVNGLTNMISGASINAGLSINNGGLSVEGTNTLLNTNFTDVSGILSVNNLTNLNGGVVINNGTTVNAGATINGDVIIDGETSILNNLDMSGNKIQNVIEPTDLSDATNKFYVDDSINKYTLTTLEDLSSNHYLKISVPFVSELSGNIWQSFEVICSSINNPLNSNQINLFKAFYKIDVNNNSFQQPIYYLGNDSDNFIMLDTDVNNINIYIQNNKSINLVLSSDIQFTKSFYVTLDLNNITTQIFENIVPNNITFIQTQNRLINDSETNDFLDKNGDTMSGELDMDSNLIRNVSDPFDSQDVATKNYVDNSLNQKLDLDGGTITGDLNVNGLSTFQTAQFDFDVSFNTVATFIGTNTNLNSNLTTVGGDLLIVDSSSIFNDVAVFNNNAVFNTQIDMKNNQIKNILDPIDTGDATNKNYVDTSLNNKLSLNGGTMNGQISMSGNKIVNLGAPVDSGDVTTKNYVDTSLNNKLSLSGGTINGSLELTEQIPNLNIRSTSGNSAIHQRLNITTHANNRGGGIFWLDDSSSNRKIFFGRAYEGGPLINGLNLNLTTTGEDVEFNDLDVLALRIDELKNIGIGCEPTQKLDVNGNLRVRGDLITDNMSNYAYVGALNLDISENTTETINVTGIVLKAGKQYACNASFGMWVQTSSPFFNGLQIFTDHGNSFVVSQRSATNAFLLAEQKVNNYIIFRTNTIPGVSGADVDINLNFRIRRTNETPGDAYQQITGTEWNLNFYPIN